VEVADSEEEEIVAAFAPSAVLGNGTDSGESDNVSDLAPLKCKHFTWKCLVDGPRTEFPLKVASLVNNGCHLVLIRPDIVERSSFYTPLSRTYQRCYQRFTEEKENAIGTICNFKSYFD
jgi:hypothetical protein